MPRDPVVEPYVAPPGLSGPEPRHKVAIVGAGPVGLSLAIDLAIRGVPSVVLDDNDVVSTGSRAICWAKRTLEIFDRLGVGERMLDNGVTWKVGRQFHRDREVYAFDLLPESGHKYPAFVNLQQYYVERYLIDRAREFGELVDLRFRNEVVAHEDCGDFVRLTAETPDGRYGIEAEWLVACDGAGSPTRRRMGLPFEGQRFEERFLIADIEMADSPFGDAGVRERWFWFDPPFHDGKSALLHAQPDNIYRIDLQLRPDADAEAEADPDRVRRRIAAVVGDRPFDLDWVSVYGFRCARLRQFVHGRILFAGDSAHVVSPFGARGGNGGIQDVDNLGWKLAAVLRGRAPITIVRSYDEERVAAADENIANSARATNFMTPKSPAEARFRSATLALARNRTFARRLLNSGRLSVPLSLEGLSLQTPGSANVAPGSAMPDAPIRAGDGVSKWLIEEIQGEFALVGFGDAPLPEVHGIRRFRVGPDAGPGPGPEPERYSAMSGLALERYGTGIAYLFRPDGHVCAAFDAPTETQVADARDRALGLGQSTESGGEPGAADTVGGTTREIVDSDAGKGDGSAGSVDEDRLGPDQDRFYEFLIRAHEGLDESECHALDARLLLLLANEVGDSSALERLVSEARAATETRQFSESAERADNGKGD